MEERVGDSGTPPRSELELLFLATLLKGLAALVVGGEIGGPVHEGGEACSPDLAEYLPLDLGGPVAEARVRNIGEGSIGRDGYPRGAQGVGPKGPGPCDLGL